MNSQFRQELEQLINRNSLENGSNTPDFILADYMIRCLETFDMTMKRRAEWYDAPKVNAHPGDSDPPVLYGGDSIEQK